MGIARKAATKTGKLKPAKYAKYAKKREENKIRRPRKLSWIVVLIHTNGASLLRARTGVNRAPLRSYAMEPCL